MNEEAVAAENSRLLPYLQCGRVTRASLETTGKLICSDDTSYLTCIEYLLPCFMAESA